MELGLLLQAILLGIVEGLTEFLPVSSTGHLILLIELLHFKGPKGHVFEVVIQLGAILAVCWVYRQRLVGAVIGAPTDMRKRRFIINILLGVIPAAVLGLLLHELIKEMLFNPWVVSVMLILGGLAILWIEKHKPVPIHQEVEDFSWKLALKIGLCQALAMIPGTSRSGATIMGALLLKVDRKAATEYSFFLAIPTMLAATSLDLAKNINHIDANDWAVIAAGFLAAFVSAMLIVRWAIGFIMRRGFVPFAWYRMVLGSVMLVLLFAAS